MGRRPGGRTDAVERPPLLKRSAPRDKRHQITQLPRPAPLQKGARADSHPLTFIPPSHYLVSLEDPLQSAKKLCPAGLLCDAVTGLACTLSFKSLNKDRASTVGP